MVTKVGELYVGRLPQYLRGVANIRYAVEEMRKVLPNADYDRVTMVGHSNGGDISMYFAKIYPDHIKKVVTLDNLRVPFMTDGRFKILSFRSKDPQFQNRSRRYSQQGNLRRDRHSDCPDRVSAHRHERPRPRRSQIDDPGHAR